MPKSLDSFNRRLEEIDASISDTENVLSLKIIQKKKHYFNKVVQLDKNWNRKLLRQLLRTQ